MTRGCVVRVTELSGVTAAETRQIAVSAERVRSAIRERGLRTEHFGDLFSDPAWDILLELFASRLEHRRHSVGTLCESINVPMTTTLRWLTALEQARLICRHQDPLDSRRVFIVLSENGSASMVNYFRSVGTGL